MYISVGKKRTNLEAFYSNSNLFSKYITLANSLTAAPHVILCQLQNACDTATCKTITNTHKKRHKHTKKLNKMQTHLQMIPESVRLNHSRSVAFFNAVSTSMTSEHALHTNFKLIQFNCRINAQ